MPSALTVEIDSDERGAKLMRGTTQIGEFDLDEKFQLQAVTISAAANSAEREMIIRLAASHVAQYCVTGRSYHKTLAGGILRATSATQIPPIPGLTRRDSRRLLDFNNLPQQHARLSVQDLTHVLSTVGVRVTQR